MFTFGVQAYLRIATTCMKKTKFQLQHHYIFGFEKDAITKDVEITFWLN